VQKQRGNPDAGMPHPTRMPWRLSGKMPSRKYAFMSGIVMFPACTARISQVYLVAVGISIVILPLVHVRV
jgi:hypothetical protein